MNNDLSYYDNISIENLIELLPKITPITLDDLLFIYYDFNTWDIKPHLNDKDKFLLIELLLSKHDMHYEHMFITTIKHIYINYWTYVS